MTRERWCIRWLALMKGSNDMRWRYYAGAGKPVTHRAVEGKLYDARADAEAEIARLDEPGAQIHRIEWEDSRTEGS